VLSERRRVAAWHDISRVLLRHFTTGIMKGESEGTMAWDIMQDVRKRMGLSMAATRWGTGVVLWDGDRPPREQGDALEVESDPAGLGSA
jgi:hypothetical protein